VPLELASLRTLDLVGPNFHVYLPQTAGKLVHRGAKGK
jgi:hypothetical protein